jgi:hypothetical protein
MVVNSHGSNGSKSLRGVYKITSLAAEPYLASASTPLPIESRRTPPSPLPTASRPHSTPHRAALPLHRLHSPPCRVGTPLPTASRRCSTVSTPHRAAPPLPTTSRRTPLPTSTSWSWPVLEDPSTTIFDTVALFPTTTMAMEMEMEMVMVVPPRSRLQPVH